ncbi:MAG: hypothetical protein Q9211_005293 [Gyalolechia sp. 1 TL-2023]
MEANRSRALHMVVTRLVSSQIQTEEAGHGIKRVDRHASRHRDKAKGCNPQNGQQVR